MAQLNNFRIDSKKSDEGDWVRPDEAYDDLEIKTRGFTDRYTDYRAVKLRRAAIPFSGDIARIPAAVSREITIEALITHCLIDVRNIVDGDGKPVTFAAFCDLLRHPDYADLVVACLKAVAMVGQIRSTVQEEAVKN